MWVTERQIWVIVSKLSVSEMQVHIKHIKRGEETTGIDSFVKKKLIKGGKKIVFKK